MEPHLCTTISPLTPHPHPQNHNRCRTKTTRPRRPGQTKRTCSPPRTANDAFSVLSYGSAKHGKPSGAGGEGDDGGCCSGGPGKRPVKCQRCGSGRVHFFATATSTRSLRGYLHLRPLQTAGLGGEGSQAPITAGGGSGACRRSNTGSSSAGQLSSAPNSSSQVSRNGALTSISSSAEHTNDKFSGWSDNGRPAKQSNSLGGSGTAGGREGGSVIDLRGTAAAHMARKASLRPP